jgi:hypothetical protein
MNCSIIGDSIAVGIAQQLPECQSVAKVGIGSAGWLGRHASILDRPQDTLVISLGSNDGDVFERGVFEAIRARAHAQHILWVLPSCNRAAHDGLLKFARTHGDIVVAFAAGHDHIHPASYKTLAAGIRGWIYRA